MRSLCRLLIILPVALATGLQPQASPGHDVSFSPVAEAYSATSVNTAVFRANSVTTSGDTQYTCFYDPEGYVTLASRPLGTDDWTVSRTPYRGKVTDAHNVISMAVDGDGYLHVSFDHHGDPLRYCRSVAPGSLILGPLEPMTGVGEEDVTYPEFHTLASGDLLFVYRSGYSGKGNMVMNRYDRSTRRWTRVHDVLIDGEGKRNAYWQLCTDSYGTIHLSWVWRETWLVETNHDLCYARSRDGGITWERSDGTPYRLPITMAEAEIAWHVPQNSELINQTSMVTDPDGRPFIATYWREQEDSVPRFRLVRHDGSAWSMETVGSRSTPFSLSGGGTKMIPISRPRVVADDSHIYYIYRDAERGSRVTLATRPVRGGVWEMSDLTDFSVDAWEPTLDNDLWRTRHLLHIYVQPSSQGDGERATTAPPSTLTILQLHPSAK
jgi:hypothetical protein